jgi:hypothetical protein
MWGIWPLRSGEGQRGSGEENSFSHLSRTQSQTNSGRAPARGISVPSLYSRRDRQRGLNRAKSLLPSTFKVVVLTGYHRTRL